VICFSDITKLTDWQRRERPFLFGDGARVRQKYGSWFEYPATVIWTYQSGTERRFRLGEVVACELPADRTMK